MQLRSRGGSVAVHAACWAIVLLMAGSAPAWAQAQQDAEPPMPEDDRVDTSKHGTVYSEIPPTRESTTGVPNRSTLKDRLLEPRWDRGGYFIGIGGLYALELSEQVGGKSGYLSSGGAHLRLGIKHDRFWQTEISAMVIYPFDDGAGGEFWMWGVYFGERFYLTKTRLQPYIGAHVGFAQFRGTSFRNVGDFAFAPKFNAGLNLYQTQRLNWELDAAYHLGVGVAEDTDFIAVKLGLTWF